MEQSDKLSIIGNGTTLPDPDYVDLMTVQDFVECVQQGLFCNDDGSGYYATIREYFSDCPALPSEIYKGIVDKRFTHIAWFNK